ncbi:MAG: type IV-A pilus assembly ATPase PilB, partial [Pseudomonadales bacterium]
MNANVVMPLSGVARRLIADQIIDENTAQEALQGASQQSQSLVSYLVQNGLADGERIANSISEEFGTPLFDVRSLRKTALPTELVDPKLVKNHHAMPLFKRGNRLFIGVSDPTNLRAQDEIKFHTGLSTECILVEEGALADAIVKYLDDEEVAFGQKLASLDDAGLEDLDIQAVDEDGDNNEANDSDVDDTPIVRFVNKVLVDAIQGGASDIHFEPYEKTYRVRFRADGILKEVTKPPTNLAPRLAARLKVMSKMDISERRVPQDGRIKMKLSKTRAIDFRVNTLPTLYGEKIVLRILDPSTAQMGIDALGYEEDQKKLYLDALHEPQGMILVTGPTGSGKTVSLYTGLNILNTTERNISSAEDPVEINVDGINQVHVNAKVGLTFAEALRSFLRQDPDVIMVGEIRDLETAEISIKAAQTGHMVMSTLHTNSAPETITRLLNMGVPAFNVATSVSLVIAQRLARRLCDHCSEPADLPHETLLAEGFKEENLEATQVMRPVGCDKCNNGYKGRVGIYEVVRITPGLQRIIMEGGNSLTLAEAAAEAGFRT